MSCRSECATGADGEFSGLFCDGDAGGSADAAVGIQGRYGDGLMLFGGGMILFWPAAVSGQYLPFLVALFTVGSGASFLETSANPFIAQFGAAETSGNRD